MLNFDEILGRVDKHSLPNTYSTAPTTSEADAATVRNFTVRAGVEKELYGILTSSENIWSRSNAPVQSLLVFGERGIEIPSREIKQKTYEDVLQEDGSIINQPTVYVEDIDPLELEEDVARVKLEADRAFFNQMLISRPAAAPMTPAQPFHRDAIPSNHSTFINPNITDRRELAFADKLHKYLKSGAKKNLVELMKEAVFEESGTDGQLADVWNDVFALMKNRKAGNQGDVENVTTIAGYLSDACSYLQKVFADHMQQVVDKNLELAQRGGVPGTRGLVHAFLKVQNDGDFEAEDDCIDGSPTWQLIYHCVRAGDMKEAAEALMRLKSFPQCATLVASLNHVARNGKLDAELKRKLKVEWRHNAGHTKDKYKRALYAALLGSLESAALIDNLENWIWFKLYPLHVDPQLTPILYQEVQKAVSIDYGEQYFMSNGVSDFQYFFTALWLSGQFERAIHLLLECGQIIDSVHIAILAHRLGYLRIVEKSTDDMLVIDSSEPTKCRLNLARLIVAYTKNFELIDVPRSLDYWFLLRGVTNPSGADVFEMAVSRSVYITNQADAILGRLSADGRRENGLIDEYLSDPSDVIARVAHDTELTGDWENAVGLYLLASKPTNAAKLLSAEISETLRTDNYERIRDLIAVAQSFQQVQRGCQPSEYATLSLLVDLTALFEHCRNEDAEQALHVSHALRLIPSEPEMVTVIINEFHMVPLKVRDVLPDACLTLMKCIVDFSLRQANEKRAGSSLFAANNRFVKQVSDFLRDSGI
ncbi:unnamed protein product [Caenorhabditis angaria]|uniref:Nuclear pore protein n=1 Tax=Caenorhabditis angaria TaxID=860376 RepID=A0A9P1MXC0_9PELO|nr:unnamed protein product [Caenorhabditis angaria]